MKTRTIRGIELTELGFGAAQLGNLYRETTDRDSQEAVDAAWDLGIRYFDVAPHYGLGLAERRLGAALASRPRDEYVISTKVGRLLVPNPAGKGRLDDEGFRVPATTRRRFDFSRDGILRSVDESLERLGIDRIDILYLHDPDDHWESASTTGVAALIELREQGVVRAVGTGMNQAPMLAEFVKRCDVDLVMCAGRYTLLDRDAEEQLLTAVAERGVGIVAAAVYNSGLLSRPTIPEDATFNYEQASPAAIAAARRLAEVCGRFGVTLPEAAVQFALRQKEVASVVLGMRTAAQVGSNVERYRAAIPERLWAEIDKALA